MIVDIHADDYGYSLNTSKDILDCMKKGCLDSVSLICNTSAFEESVDLLYKAIPSLPFLPKISVHLNFVEGTFESKRLPQTWIHLYTSNNSLKEDLKKEIKNQIEIANEVVENCIEIAKKNNIKYSQKGLRIDSHTHTHHINIIWKSIIEAIEEEKYNVEYIRNSKEPLLPFIKNVGLLSTYRPINIVKNRILMLYSKKIDKYCEKHNYKKMYIWGLIMSGYMDFDRINTIYKDMYAYANKHNRDLEILFHPGMATSSEIGKEINKDYFKDFNGSKNRHVEKDAVLRIKEIMR